MAQYDVRGVVRPEDWKTDSSSFLDKLTPEMIDLIALTALFLLIIERRESRTNFIKEGTLSSIILISLTVTPFVALITALAIGLFSVPREWFIPSYCVCFWLGYAIMSRPEKKQSQTTTTAYHASPPPRNIPYTPAKRTVPKAPHIKHAPATNHTQTTAMQKTAQANVQTVPQATVKTASQTTAQTIADKASITQNAPQQQRTYSTAPPAYRQKPPQPVSRTLKNHIIYYTCISVYTVIAYFLTLLLVNNIDPSERGFVFIFIIIFITIGAFLSSALKHHFARQ